MKPISFHEANLILPAKSDKDNPMPVYYDKSANLNISCWKLSVFERLKVVLGLPVWLMVHTGIDHPPVILRCGKNPIDSQTKIRYIVRNKLHHIISSVRRMRKGKAKLA